MRLSTTFDRVGGYGVAAGALLVISVFCLLIELQSPDKVLWTGKQTVGNERDGIIYYGYQGTQYSLDGNNFDNRRGLTVYFDPSNPQDTAMTDSTPDRVVDVVTTIGLFGLSVVLLTVGLVRRPRRRLDDRLQRLIDKRAAAAQLKAPPSS